MVLIKEHFVCRFVQSDSGQYSYQFLIPIEDCRPPVNEGCSSTEDGGGCDLGSIENTIIIQTDSTIQVIYENFIINNLR
jgi:hypothetical protein